MNKTKEQLIQYRDAIDAHLARKPVQNSNNGVDWCASNPDWTAHYYRPTPELKVIPWTRETCPPLPFEIRYKVTGSRWTLTGAQDNYAFVSERQYNWDAVLNVFDLPDGSPCGQTV